MTTLLPAGPPGIKRPAFIHIPTALAYSAGATLTLASAATNVRYALTKADGDPTMQAIWCSVAVAASIALALAPSAIVASLGQRRYGSAVLSLVAAVIFGAYSVTAALGAATGGRLVAAIAAEDVAEKRKDGRKRLAVATAELDKLTSIRPSAVVQAEIGGVYTRTPGLTECREHDPNWRPSKLHREACKTISTLEVEKASADRKAELHTIVDNVQFSLDAMKATGTVANTDAAALKGFADALGLSVSTDTLNRLLVVLAVLVIELGGGLAFAVAGGLSSGHGSRTESAAVPPVSANASLPALAPPATLLPAPSTTDSLGMVSAVLVPTAAPMPVLQGSTGCPPVSAAVPLPTGPDGRLIDLLSARGGELSGGLRSIGDAIGLGRTATADLLAELSAAGRVVVESGRRGTVVRLSPEASRLSPEASRLVEAAAA